MRTRSPAYRWLVRTRALPRRSPSRTAARGTRAWRLPGPRISSAGRPTARSRGTWPSRRSPPAKRRRVYVNAPGARTVTVQVYRMGWYGGTGGRLVLQSARLPAIAQPPVHPPRPDRTDRVSTGTPRSPSRIPQALPSGVLHRQASTPPTEPRATACSSLRAAARQAAAGRDPHGLLRGLQRWGGDSLYPGGSRRVDGDRHSTRASRSPMTVPTRRRPAPGSSSSARWRWCASSSATAIQCPTRRSSRSTAIPARWIGLAR